MGWNSQLDYILYYTFLLKWFLVLGLGHGGEFLEGANFHGKFYIPGKLITWNPRVFRLGRWLFLFKQEIFRFQPLIFPGCMFHKFFPPKTRASVGGRALDQVIIDQKMQKQLCQVEKLRFFCQRRWQMGCFFVTKTPKTGGKNQPWII